MPQETVASLISFTDIRSSM